MIKLVLVLMLNLFTISAFALDPWTTEVCSNFDGSIQISMTHDGVEFTLKNLSNTLTLKEIGYTENKKSQILHSDIFNLLCSDDDGFMTYSEISTFNKDISLWIKEGSPVEFVTNQGKTRTVRDWFFCKSESLKTETCN